MNKQCEKYEKPSIKMVPLRSQKAIADTCWGYHGTGNVNYYYDTEGKGFVKFTVNASSCTLNDETLLYYESKDDREPEVLIEGPIHEEWLKAIKEAGGNSGNPVKGHGTIFVPDQPGDSMS